MQGFFETEKKNPMTPLAQHPVIIDTHAHYDDAQYDPDRGELLAGFPAQGVGRVINASAEYEDLDAVLQLTETYSHVFATVGVHPTEVMALEREGDAAMARMEALCAREKVVAVGEIGLDYHYDEPPRDLQERWFRAQIAMAKRVGLPVEIHSRDAAADTLRILKETDACANGGDMHCYSYSLEVAKQVLDMGFYLGIGGVVTFKNAKKLKEVVAYMPLDRILLETDAPYLAPEPHRGTRNSSAYLTGVVEEIARLKEISPERVIEATCENARRLFPKLY